MARSPLAHRRSGFRNAAPANSASGFLPIDPRYEEERLYDEAIGPRSPTWFRHRGRVGPAVEWTDPVGDLATRLASACALGLEAVVIRGEQERRRRERRTAKATAATRKRTRTTKENRPMVEPIETPRLYRDRQFGDVFLVQVDEHVGQGERGSWETHYDGLVVSVGDTPGEAIDRALKWAADRGLTLAATAKTFPLFRREYE